MIRCKKRPGFGPNRDEDKDVDLTLHFSAVGDAPKSWIHRFTPDAVYFNSFSAS